MKKYKPTKEEAKADQRIKAMQKVWEKMYPFEMAMTKEAVRLALPKATRDLLDRRVNCKENWQAVVKFFDQVDGLKK